MRSDNDATCADRGFITRVAIRNYKSIAACDVRPAPLSFLVGPNGSGKSNFLDAIRFVADALRGSFGDALLERGGIDEVLHRFGERTADFGTGLDFRLAGGARGHYTFIATTKGRGGYVIQREECVVDPAGGGSPHYYEVEEGQVVRSSICYPPVCASDRLYLVPVSSLPEFRPVYDMLTGIEIYHLEVDRLREWQRYDPRPRLKRNGSNLASILAGMEARAAERKRVIKEYLAAAVPEILDFESREVGPRLTVEFLQGGGSSKLSERFLASDMSDGILRMLGVLVALFQGDGDHGTGPSLVGIEEPETGLHPEAAAMLVDALGEASERVQVMVSSHSADLLDEKAVHHDSILAAGFRQGRTNIGPLDAAMRSVIRDRVSTAGELLRIGYTTPDPELSVPGEDQPFRNRD